MDWTRRALKAVAALLPLGAIGVSTALAAAPAQPMTPAGGPDQAAQGVASRLREIRAAVSAVTAEQAGLQPGDPNIQKAWWGNWHPGWGNGGWGNGWRNGGWHNWHNGWGNGGWGNGGWRNWPNFWRNW